MQQVKGYEGKNGDIVSKIKADHKLELKNCQQAWKAAEKQWKKDWVAKKSKEIK